MKNSRIAIVEDDEVLLNLMEKVLKRDKKIIKTYNNPIKFFKDYKIYNPEIIITDIKMPEMSGLELVDNIRTIDKDIPIIITSAFGKEEYFLKAIENKIDFFMVKPIEIELLTEKINDFEEQLELKKRLKLEKKKNEEYQKYLENKIEEEVEKRVHQEKILERQSRLAAMGEMMDAVAHQWKQPLTIMGGNVEILEDDFKTNNLDEKLMNEFVGDFKMQMLHMLNTLEQFRNFFRPNKKQETFFISDIIDFTLMLTKDEFIKNKIVIEKNIEENFELFGSSNEFAHLILNIINNAKDAFNEREIKNRIIKISTKKDEKFKYLIISDNAGGIPEDILPKIFKPNVTTKPEGVGTGIGLYFSRQIALKFHGRLMVKNINGGVEFTFRKRVESK